MSQNVRTTFKSSTRVSPFRHAAADDYYCYCRRSESFNAIWRDVDNDDCTYMHARES